MHVSDRKTNLKIHRVGESIIYDIHKYLLFIYLLYNIYYYLFVYHITNKYYL